MTESILAIPVHNLAEGKIEISGLYAHCKMLVNLFIESYEGRVMFKQVKPIEMLMLEEKQYLWDEAGKLTVEKEERIRVAKMIYMIDVLLSKKYL